MASKRLYLKSIKLENIQSHVDTFIELPEKGLVRFTGRNSNGKSVFTKTLSDVIRGRLHIKREREPLIRRGCKAGLMQLTRSDGAKLTTYISMTPSETYVELQLPGQEPVRRYVTTDKNDDELVREFGFHYEPKRGVSLNLYDTYDPLMLVTTSPRENEDLILSVIADEKASNAIVAMQEVMKDLKLAQEKIMMNIKNNELIVASMEFVPEAELSRKSEKLKELVESIEKLTVPEKFPKIPFVPDFTQIEKTNVGKLLDDTLKMSILVKVMQLVHQAELMTIKQLGLKEVRELASRLAEQQEAFDNGVCYACGRGFNECNEIHIS